MKFYINNGLQNFITINEVDLSYFGREKKIAYTISIPTVSGTLKVVLDVRLPYEGAIFRESSYLFDNISFIPVANTTKLTSFYILENTNKREVTDEECIYALLGSAEGKNTDVFVKNDEKTKVKVLKKINFQNITGGSNYFYVVKITLETDETVSLFQKKSETIFKEIVFFKTKAELNKRKLNYQVYDEDRIKKVNKNEIISLGNLELM